MCHRLYLFLLCLLLLCGLCMSSALASGGDEVQQEDQLLPSLEDMSQEEFYTLVGVDAFDEEQVQQFLSWLFDLNCGADYQDFCYCYMMAGYEQPGCAYAYTVYLTLRDYEPQGFTVTTDAIFTRYTGEDVQLLYLNVATGGYPAGTWFLGTPGRTGSGGYFGEPHLLNITEVKEKLANVVTQQDLTALETILNTINSNIVSGNSYFKDTSFTVHISNVGGSNSNYGAVGFFDFFDTLFFRHFQNLKLLMNSGQVQDKLFYDYLTTTSVIFPSYNSSGGSISYGGTGIMQALEGLSRAVTSAVRNMALYQVNNFDDFYKNTDWAYLFYTPEDGGGVSEDVSGTGLYALLGTGFSRTTLAITEGSRDNVNALLGKTEQMGQFYSYDDDGQLVLTTLSGSSIAAILLGSLSRLQADTAALHYVLADDDAVRLHTANKPLEDAIEDNFTGDKPASPGVSDISDAAGITSGLRDALGDNPVSSSQFFQSVSSDDNYSFFSQQTQQDLDTVGSSFADVAPASIYGGRDDAWLDDYTFDENGFGTLRDDSFFSLSAFLGR